MPGPSDPIDADRPVTVVAASNGKHLFQGMRDPRLRLHPGPASECADADLIVFPAGTIAHLDGLGAAEIPEPLQGRLAAGEVGVVLDASMEGEEHTPERAAAMHETLRRWQVSPLNCVYVTQDRNHRADYLAHCAATGLGPPVAVVNHDYWIWLVVQQFEGEGKRTYEALLAAFQARASRRERRFMSLNLSPRPSKVLFLLSLLRDGHWDSGFISFGGFRPEDGQTSRPSARRLKRHLPGFDDLIDELAPLIDALDSRGRQLLGGDIDDWKTLKHASTRTKHLSEYGRSWFSVVTETEMRPRISRITEKPFKPLVNFHPVLMLGNPGALGMIRDLGFATFEEVFDESYDDELDPRKRFDLVYREFERLCRLDEDELLRIERKIADKLIFNARWGFTGLSAQRRRQNDIRLMDDILAGVRRRPG